MWVFSREGFFSAVKDNNCNNDELMIRARCRDDLINLGKKLYGFCDESKIIKIEHADYRFRMKLTRVLWSEYLSECALDLDYPNVKDHIIPEGDYKRHNAYFVIWQALFHWQSEIESHGKDGKWE